MKKLISLEKLRRALSVGIIATLIGTMAPWADMIPAFAQIDAGNDIKIDSIDFAKEHNGMEMTSAYVQIIGSGLKDVTALFEKTVTSDPLPLGNGGFQAIGTKISFGSDTINDTILKYTFTEKEAKSLTGKVLIGSRVIDLNLSSFPNINTLNLKNVNVTTNDDLIMTGNNLDKVTGVNVAGTTVKGTYGRDLKKEFVQTGSANTITLTDPKPESSYGFQDIEFTRTSTITIDATNTAPVSVRYTYGKAFRFTQNLGLTNVEMYPDIGATGDYLYLTADAFPPANYQVYLMKKLDGTEEYSDNNRATTINLDAAKKQLVVQIPNTLTEGDYNVVLTKVENGEVVAEQIVLDGTDPDVYTVVDSLKKLKIEQISPTTGPDTGVDVTVVAKNMVNINIPGLSMAGPPSAPTSEDSDKTLVVDYGNGTFNSKPVTVVRKVSIFVGNKATFKKNGAVFDVDFGTDESPDKANIRTAGIDDVLTDPKKDVLIETETTLTATDGSGKVYVFKQSATLKDSFTFIPSTLTPVIDKVTPDKIQIVTTVGSTHKLKQDTLLVIKGSKFNVYKKVNADGSVELKKPSVFIKGVGNISENQYQIALLPNDSGGVIKTKVADADAVVTTVRDALNNIIKLDMTVLNDKNEVVDGTVGNDVGTKIVVKLPDEITMKIANVKKNIQISNPRLGSEDYGNAVVKYDAIEFLTTSDYPIIETVAPNVVSVDGGVEVLVRGTNFANGVKVYLDGEEVTGVKREVDTSGDKINLKFDAPEGRVGLTQLQIMNPTGGMAVWDFNYVKSFDKDPTITSFSPTRGIYGTLVSVNGDNYLKPDPTAPTNLGLDAFRLIGSKIYLDNKDVNQYNQDANGNLQFLPYEAPDGEALIQIDANGQTRYSELYKNAYAYSYDTAAPADSTKYRLYYLEKDESKRPVLTDKDQRYYVFRYNTTTSHYEVYGKDGQIIDNDVTIANDPAVTGLKYDTLITIDDPAVTGGVVHIKGSMDNNLIRKDMNPDGTLKVKPADYARSVILQEETVAGVYSFFTLSEDFEGNAKLSNGKDQVYKIILEGGVYKALADSGTKSSIVLDHDPTNPNHRLILDGTINLDFTTAYKTDASTKIITGNRVKVVSKDQILFTVPVLSSGTGTKDLEVVNPDTKKASKTGADGFYYVSQAGSYPVITSIDPAEGSDEGGYTVTIHGADFQDGVKVIVDSQTVPDKDQFLALDGKSISFTMPKSIKDLKNDYGVDRFTVPVVVLNADGASDSIEKGFTYIKPSSIPKITKIIAADGSANGNEIVEIFGSDFRFFEPFKDGDSDGSSYELGDTFTDLNGNGKWDNYLTYLQNFSVDANGLPNNAGSQAILDARVADSTNPYHTYYYSSKVFPRIFFGSKEAKIVHYGNGYIKVITPDNAAGPVSVYVVNNDSGLTNKVTYTYKASKPTISSIIPNIGRKMGQELKELYGADLYRSSLKGYYETTDTVPVTLPNIQGKVKFGEITNEKIDRNQPNSGLINNGQATINLTGALKVTYSADPTPTLTVQVQEKGKVYSKVFAYDNTDVYLPMGMLLNGTEYYSPTGYTKADPTVYDKDKDVFEYVRVRIEDRRVLVERGYAPQVTYDNAGHVTVMTPSYYTIDKVPVTYTNPDGGTTKVDFTYTNPASNPKIYDMKPKVNTEDNTGFMVEGSVKGNWEFEIRGEDFREGATVSINGKAATVVEITKVTIPDPANPTGPQLTFDNIIVKVPAGTTDDVDKKYPVFVQNLDNGIANSTTLDNRIGPDAGKPIYFVYRKPLSDPVIKEVIPKETSVAGGNTVTITGTDFRTGASVIVGSKNGVPMPNVVVSNQGTKITFTTATNLTLGAKSVTVQNADFGSVTKDNALTVISAPVVYGNIYDKDGVTVKNRISLEGGEEIVIKGEGFTKDSMVYFGPAPTLITSDTPDGTYGLYRDDRYYKLEDATAASSVTYVDANTLKVTTPERLIEGKVSVTVLNGDKGISGGSTEMIYTVPVPSDPVNLNAELIAEQYIRLYGYTASKSDYYEVYYYIGGKTEAELRVGQYKDFQYLGNTDLEPYRITKLPGLEKIVDKQYLYFVIKAVNKFGASNYSNIAVIPYANLKNVKNLGQKDLDGAIGVPDGKAFTTQVAGNKSIIQLSAKLPDKDLNIVIDKNLAKTLTTRVINVPQAVVFDGRGLYSVSYGDSTVQFMPQHLNTDAFRDMTFDASTYGQLLTGPQNNAYGSALKAVIPREQKAVSQVFSIAPYAVNNNSSKKTTQFNGSVDFAIAYDTTGLSSTQEKSIRMYYYDSITSKWVMVKSTLDTAKNVVSARVTKAGEYILLVQK